MGLANKIAYKFATKMFTTFEQAKGLVKAQHVGAVTKVKKEVLPTPTELEVVFTQFDPQLPILLFVGGSAGARVFNEFVTNNREALLASYNVINLTGNSSLNEQAPHLYRVDYVTDHYLPLLQKADLVVTRGGANTIFELLAMNKLHIIVPLGKEASRGDQIENAQYFVEKGYAEAIAEPNLSMNRLQETIEKMFQESDRYHQAMKASKELLSLDDFYSLVHQEINKRKK